MSSTAPTVGDDLRVVNPATLLEVGRVRRSAPEEVHQAVAEARLAQRDWARCSLDARSRLLVGTAEAVLDAVDEIAATVTEESGKPLLESVTADVFVALDNLVWLARNLGRVLRDERIPFPQVHLWHKRGWLRYEPLGVVGVVSPWNFPFGIPLTQAATAVAAGNAVVVKPAEETPLSGAWVEEVFRRAGAPPGLVRVVQGEGETTGDALVRAPGVAKIVFTGSVDVGRAVAERCAERLRPLTLELGGKDPMLVLRDADLDRAIEGALWGSFTNCGQVCSGIERIYVARELHGEFLERLALRAQSLRPGRGDDPETDLGPLITESQRARVEGLVADATRGGAEVVTGGHRPELDLPGWFYSPTVLSGVADDARLRLEEIFGPVVSVDSFDNEAEAIRKANDSQYALGASVWTRDRARARNVAGRLEAGSVWMNDVCYSYGACQAPWGGTKASGYGRTHSRHGLYALSHLKFADADTGRLRPPWWYPYGTPTVAGFRSALDVLYRRGPRARLGAVWRGRRPLAALARRALTR